MGRGARPRSGSCSSPRTLSTLGLDAFGDAVYAGDEPHYLLAAQSFAEDRDADVLDEYRERDYRELYPYALEPHGPRRDGRLHEPLGSGCPPRSRPAYALGGRRARGADDRGCSPPWRSRSPTCSRCGWCPTRGRSARRWRGPVAADARLLDGDLPRPGRRAALARRRAARAPDRRAAAPAQAARLLRPARAAAVARPAVRAGRRW